MLPIFDQFSFKAIETLSGSKLGIRGWKTKEDRILLFAIDGMENEEDVNEEIKKMSRSCCNDLQVFDSLSTQNLLWVIAQQRKLSKGDTIEFNYDCKNCKFPLSSSVSIDDDLITKKFDSSPIKIGSDYVFSIKEVSDDETKKLRQKFTKVSEYNFNFVLKSIDSVVYKGVVYDSITEDNLSQFIDSMDVLDSDELYKKIDDAQIALSMTKKITCGKCKHDNEIDFGVSHSFLALS